jgi:hypothetical protein
MCLSHVAGVALTSSYGFNICSAPLQWPDLIVMHKAFRQIISEVIFLWVSMWIFDSYTSMNWSTKSTTTNSKPRPIVQDHALLGRRCLSSACSMSASK